MPDETNRRPNQCALLLQCPETHGAAVAGRDFASRSGIGEDLAWWQCSKYRSGRQDGVSRVRQASSGSSSPHGTEHCSSQPCWELHVCIYPKTLWNFPTFHKFLLNAHLQTFLFESGRLDETQHYLSPSHSPHLPKTLPLSMPGIPFQRKELIKWLLHRVLLVRFMSKTSNFS